MEATELRIGNLFMVGGCFYRIGTETFGLISNDESYLDRLIPIPLTEEWLLRCGFEKVQDRGDSTYFWKNKLLIALTADFKLSTSTIEYDSQEVDNSIVFKYLHELQNITFDLTGEELEIKEI